MVTSSRHTAIIALEIKIPILSTHAANFHLPSGSCKEPPPTPVVEEFCLSTPATGGAASEGWRVVCKELKEKKVIYVADGSG